PPAAAYTLSLHDALPILMQSEQVVVTSPYAGTTAFNELGGDYAFRTVGPDTNDGLAAAKWIADQGYESVAVFTQQEEQTLSAGEDRKSTRLNSSHVKISY